MTAAVDRKAPNPLARGTVLASAALTIMAPAIIAPSLPTMDSLMIAVSAPVSGMIADRVGRRPLLVSGPSRVGAGHIRLRA
ncbi:MFS family permease [Lipingzhangella halophila]|uniref:MFS family permease n=1 Tax=Lipingzhangella halophila TaxID=1783352 RepID=A0A7W7RMK0_9ACTN|nr:hypothetical protein [Lipingzhangella halophila]MBB4934749.1 MFS family permease [Lipingzhangella halophila]